MNSQKTLNALLLTGFILCLLQIWLPAFYLTGDGPSHVYNAQILHDLWCNKNTAFYAHYYQLVYQPNPNWLSTIVLALLMFVVNGIVAEKIYLTLYVLLYTRGFYLLLKKISGSNSYWPLVIFLFVFTHVLAKGFYNFSFSIAFYFWVVWSWIRFLDRRNIGNALLFIVFTALVYFTHLLSFCFGAVTCAALVFSYAVSGAWGTGKEARKTVLIYCGAFAVLLAPFAILMVAFTQKEGGLKLELGHHFFRVVELLQFKYMVNFTNHEKYFAMVAGFIISLLLVFSLFKFRVKAFRVNKYDGFFLSLIFVMLVYCFFPESFLGRLILITIRVQPFAAILTVCCVAYMLPTVRLKNMAALVLLGCFTGLFVTRIYAQVAAAEGVTDYISGADKIKAYSVVLPLDFEPAGKDAAGNIICDRNWSFSHASEYLGLSKPLIILDNYEANMGYFPLIWKDSVNPYFHLDKYEGIEAQPPSAGINEYKRTTGVTIDYILMWCYDPLFLSNEHFRSLYGEITGGYHVVYKSPSGRSILWEVNR